MTRARPTRPSRPATEARRHAGGFPGLAGPAVGALDILNQSQPQAQGPLPFGAPSATPAAKHGAPLGGTGAHGAPARHTTGLLAGNHHAAAAAAAAAFGGYGGSLGFSGGRFGAAPPVCVPETPDSGAARRLRDDAPRAPPGLSPVTAGAAAACRGHHAPGGAPPAGAPARHWRRPGPFGGAPAAAPRGAGGASSTGGGSVGLNKRLMSACSTGELLDIVRQHGAVFDFFNISTAIARVPKLAGPQGCGAQVCKRARRHARHAYLGMRRIMRAAQRRVRAKQAGHRARRMRTLTNTGPGGSNLRRQMDPTCKALVDDLARLMEDHIDSFDARGELPLTCPCPHIGHACCEHTQPPFAGAGP